jgi:anti-sigma factor RsiW
MSDHLSDGLLNALVDGELSPEQLAAANEHLAQCAACTSKALFQSLLKSANARAGQRYAPPAQLHDRLARLVKEQTALQEPLPLRESRRPAGASAIAGWAVAAALLLASGSILVFEHNAQHDTVVSSESAALVTEACDQHIATLAGNALPQVISSDRHTVKPWFQGKIPFSFNLPENLPTDTRLEGANLTYLHNQPAALLLYSIGKHRVSVFVLQRTSTGPSNAIAAEHAGFHVTAFSTADLDIFAVSDVDPVRLSNLSSLIEHVQDGVRPQTKQQ